MSITIVRSALSFPGRKAPKKNFISYRQEVEKYKALLHSIAIKLGLSEKESNELTEDVCLIGERNFFYQKENLSLKIWLTKILVRNCIFKVCSSLFSQNPNTINFFQPTKNNLIGSSVSKIPISFRTVYILLHSVEFTESEVAQILSITPMQVRERLAKATSMIKDQHF